LTPLHCLGDKTTGRWHPSLDSAVWMEAIV